MPADGVAWSEDDLLVLHAYGGSEPEDLLAAFPGRKALYFHNLTPAEFFAADTPRWRHTREAERRMARLAALADVVMAPSEFNLDALEGMGAPRRSRHVIPPPIDVDAERAAPADGRWLAALRGRGETNFLCIGRLAPNKRQDRVMDVFAHYHRRIDRRSRLHLVGDAAFEPSYTRMLEACRREHGAGRAIEITGQVSEPVLEAYHRTADVHLYLSEHEGLCLPPLAAMVHGVPVFARAAAALPETLGDGAVLVHGDDPRRLAELVHLVLADATLRARIVEAGRARLAHYHPARIRRLWEDLIADLGRR